LIASTLSIRAGTCGRSRPRSAIRFVTNTVAVSAGYRLRFARALLLTGVCTESPSHEHV
jgi:hypothetical protein